MQPEYIWGTCWPKVILCTWAVRQYPAQYYLLRLADHGYGWKGLLTVYYDIMGHPKYNIDRRIFEIRSAMTDFEDPNVDLYDFCQRIVNAADN